MGDVIAFGTLSRSWELARRELVEDRCEADLELLRTMFMTGAASAMHLLGRGEGTMNDRWKVLRSELGLVAEELDR